MAQIDSLAQSYEARYSASRVCLLILCQLWVISLKWQKVRADRMHGFVLDPLQIRIFFSEPAPCVIRYSICFGRPFHSDRERGRKAASLWLQGLNWGRVHGGICINNISVTLGSVLYHQ